MASNDPFAGNLDQYTVKNLEAQPAPADPFANPNFDQYIPNNKHVATEPYSALDTITNTAGSLAKDAGKAVVRAGASLLDMATGFNGPMTTEEMLYPDKKPLPELHSKAKEALPYTHNILGEGAEGAIVGGITGGPIGASIGAISSGGTEALNEYNPGHPIANALIPMGAGLVAGPAIARNVGRTAKLGAEGLGLSERDPLVQAKKDLNITAGTAASTSDDPFWFKMQRGLRERVLTPKSGNIENAIEEEQKQLGSAVQKQGETIFPNAGSKQQVGTGVQTAIEDGVDTVKRIFSRQENALDAVVNPNTTLVDMRPLVNRAITDMASSPGAHIPIAGGGTQTGDKVVTRLMDNIIQYGNSTNGLPVQAIRELKQQVGDALKESLLNGDANARQLRQMYGVLADAQGAAYAGTPYARQYTALKAAEAEMYGQIETWAQPLIKQGITPERMADMATNQMKLGGTKLVGLINVMNQASPSIRNQMASSILQNIGKDAQGEFSPQRFFTRWQQMAPEARAALFHSGPYQNLDKVYDQLALVAQNQARGAKAVNTSGTGGVNELFNELKTWGTVLGGGVGIGIGTADQMTASKQDQAGETDRLTKGAEGAGIGYAIAHLGGSMVMGRMLTNPAFLRWIATPTVQNIPNHAKALSAVAAESPELAPAISSFQEYLQNKHAAGGYVSPYYTANDNNSLLDRLFGGVKQGLPTMNPMPNPNKGINPLDPAMQGANQNSKINGYAEGGNVGDDYNTPLSVLDEIQFQHWKQQYAPNDSGADYDLRGAYKSGFTPDPETGHWKDEYKKPNHPTFSNESKYSRENPNLPAGSWAGDTFLPPRMYAEGGPVNDNINSGNIISFGKQPKGGYAGAERTPITPSSVGAMKAPYEQSPPSILDVMQQAERTRNAKGESLIERILQGRAVNDNNGYAEGGSVNDDLGKAREAIKSIESGGRYEILHKAGVNKSGRYQALGAYGFLDKYLADDSRKFYGQEVDKQTFLKNPSIQDTMFNNKFGQYVQKYGLEGAARAWFAGPGGMNNLKASDGNASVAQYRDKFLQKLGQPTQTVSSSAAEGSKQKSLIDHIMPSASFTPVIEDEHEEVNNTQPSNAERLAQEHSQHAASAGMDPLVQSVISTIWRHSSL